MALLITELMTEAVELFFLLNTYFQNSFMGEAVFSLLLQRHKLG